MNDDIDRLVNELEDAAQENRFNDANQKLIDLTSSEINPRLLVCGLRFTSKWPLHLVPYWNSALAIAHQRLSEGGYDTARILRGLNKRKE